MLESSHLNHKSLTGVLAGTVAARNLKQHNNNKKTIQFFILNTFFLLFRNQNSFFNSFHKN